MDIITDIMIGIALHFVGFCAGFCVSGMVHVAKYEDYLIEREIQNMKERNKNDKGI